MYSTSGSARFMAAGRGEERSTIFGRLMSTLTRSKSTVEKVEVQTAPEDLGLKTLRQVYAQYAHILNPVEKEMQLYKLLPLFYKNCRKMKGPELVTKFPEAYEFAENVSFLLVRHVTQIAQSSNIRAGVKLLEYFEWRATDREEASETGLVILKTIRILSNGPEKLVASMMSSNLSAILVRCIHLFLDLPPPASAPTHLRTEEQQEEEGASCPPQEEEEDMGSEMSQRISLQRQIESILNKLLRHIAAVENLLHFGDLALLFGAISSPCPPYNKIWRKAAANCLMTICRRSLTGDVISFIHKKGCIGFCVRNIKLAVEQPPLELVEIFATIFCCLKDSSDFSQVLLDDFSSSGGYKLLYEYLLHLERMGTADAREAERNMVLLISNNLVPAGFLTLEPTLNDGGPFQDPGFSIPAPQTDGSAIKSIDAFLVLQDAFLSSKSSHLGNTILDIILNVYRADPANYFILDSLHTLSQFLEILPQKNDDVQGHVFHLLEFIMMDLNYVPSAELTSIGLLLQMRQPSKTLALALNFLLKLISHGSKYKNVFRDVGVLMMLISALKAYAAEMKTSCEDQVAPRNLSSPSLPLDDVQGEEEEYIFLLTECLRATIEGNVQNGRVFRENGGMKCTLEMASYKKPRRMALRLVTQLILLEDGSVDFNALLDLLNTSPQTAVGLKAEILHGVLRVFQLDSSKKAVFREVCGFHYLISLLASLIASLSPCRSAPWIGVSRLDIINLLQLVFTVMTTAMQDDPANKMFFENNIRFDSFTAPLKLLGCFVKDCDAFSPSQHLATTGLTSGMYTSFDAEFKTWRPPQYKIDENSAVYSAAQIFRFLRDMALDIPVTQSQSLLQVQQKEKNFYSSPLGKGLSLPHLVHPGAVLCMVDLLPGINLDFSYLESEKSTPISDSVPVIVIEDTEDGSLPGVVNGDLTNEMVESDLTNQKTESELTNEMTESDGVLTADSASTQGILESPTSEEAATTGCRGDGSAVGDVRERELERLVFRESREGSVEDRKEGVDEYSWMSPNETRKWCVFLQERVVAEIYSMASSERNQQALCQVGLPQRILQRCSSVLAEDSHPLHQALERTFEKLSYQALTPADFRNFLRLGNPLSCSINDITVEELKEAAENALKVREPETSKEQEVETPPSDYVTKEDNVTNEKAAYEKPEFESKLTNQIAPYGDSLSLARIQSLVSMTTPRDGYQPGMIGNPPFVEFDLSIDGFGCLFFPSIFPQTVVQNAQGGQAANSTTTGIGAGGERPFPPNNGITFSTWIFMSRCPMEDSHPIGLFTLSQCFLTTEKKLHSYPCFRIYLTPSEQTLSVTTHIPRDRRDPITEDILTKPDSKEKVEEVTFSCPQVFQVQTWHHVAVVVNKTLRGKARVTLYVDSNQIGAPEKMTYIHLIHLLDSTHFLPYPSETMPFLINAHIGTHVTQRHVSKLTYRLGPTFLFEDPVAMAVIHTIYKLGPSYFGSFQAPILNNSLSPGAQSDPLSPLVLEERVVFGLIAAHTMMKTIHELAKNYSNVDVATIARELSVKEDDDVTPISFLHNTAFHLFGPSRTLGAIMCGYSGIRAFEPQPLRSLLSSVGGTSVVLGLVAMASTVDSLYASMKALVCIVGNNQFALKEMERMGGFQVLGMLLRCKSHLINSNILHLTYTLVGTVNSEHESACIPSPIAFRDLLADLAIWGRAGEEIQRSLFNHFYELLTHSSFRFKNAEQMLGMKLVSLLLFRLHDNRLSRPSIKATCNVLSALLGSRPAEEDIRRVGQLLVTTLPTSKQYSENTISLYHDETTPLQEELPTEHAQEEDGLHDNKNVEGFTEHAQEENGLHDNKNVEGFTEHAQFVHPYGNKDKRRRDIMLRNMLLDVLFSLLTNDQLQLNTQFAHQLYNALGLDWLMLFLHSNVHIDTVTKALRMLVNLLCDPTLFQKFHSGEIYGGWVRGFETISMEMSELLDSSTDMFRPLRGGSQLPLPGAMVLSVLLPNHLQSPQVFLLVFAILLGNSGNDIPFSASFDLEALDSIFHVGSLLQSGQQVRLCPDAAYILLAMTRVLLHQTPSDSATRNLALTLIKFFERLYRILPDFTSLTMQQEFIEALTATLYPPTRGDGEGEPSFGDDDGFVVVTTHEKDQQPIEIKPALLRKENPVVCSVIKLLRTIAVNGFASTQMSPKDVAVCPVLETVLLASPGSASPVLQKEYQTMILNNIVEYLQSGNEDILVLFRNNSGANYTRSITGLSVFCSRLVDKLWQGVYLKPSSDVYTFLISLIEQARKQPNTLPLGDLQRSLNRVILYQVSTIPTTDTEQKALMDTLCLFSSQAHILFDDTNVDSEFLECLMYRLLQIAFSDRKQGAHDARLTGGYVPVVSMSMMKSGANRLWSKMLEYKREALEQILGIELPVMKKLGGPNPIDAMGLDISRQFTASSSTNTAYTKLQNCQGLMTEQLTKAWDDYLVGERSHYQPIQESISKGAEPRKSFLTLRRRKERERARSTNLEGTVQEYTDTLCPLLVLAAQKYDELLLRKHLRNSEYKLRFTATEWGRIEYELIRERGLWGPERPSPLDKWMLDSVEGPFRMRKRTCRNSLFYLEYQYNPTNEQQTKSKHQKPASIDSKFYYQRGQLFQHSATLLATPSSLLPSSFHGNLARIQGNDALMNVSIEYHDASSAETPPPPSSTPVVSRPDPLNQPDTDDPVAQALYKMIEPDDKITARYQCARLTGLDSRDGILILGTTHFYVVEGVTVLKTTGEIIDIESAETDSYDPVVPSHLHFSTIRKEGMPVPIGCIKWPYDTIREIHKRRYLLRPCALEVFSSDGRNHFLIFKQQEKDRIYQRLSSLAKSSLSESEFVAGTHPDTNPEQAPGLFTFLLTGERALPERWANGEMSNFQYLMHLNTLAGRSYNDLMQYPIFPWVLADYENETLDLTNPKTFRDFSKPMGAQTSSRLARFIERYSTFEDPTGENTPPYYYGTHYSSAMIVASYLIRMEPFTQHFLKLQGGHFDLPDRLFHSVPDAWRSASETNMADIKELIPEFFYLPEFLVNSNRFDLGTKQSGETLNDIILPPWSKGDPLEFIRLHREALECDYVSAHLHEWIDLIFGYKQKGEEALKAHNVFHQLFYEGTVDIDKIDDPVKRNATISFIHNFGQMPKQLFRRPHRARKVFAPLGNPATDAAQAPPTNLLDSRRVFYKNLVQLMPSKEPVKEIRNEVSQILSLGDRHLVAVERNRLLLPPLYNRYFMWGFPDRSARIALVDGDRVTSVFEGLHQGRIVCATAVDENMLLTGGDSTVVCVWNMKSTGFREKTKTQLHLMHTLHGHTASVTCLATSPNYNLIVSGSKDRTCILWDINKFAFVRQLCGHSGPVTIVTINQLNGNIVSCTKSQVRLWTVNGTLLAETTIMITGNFRLQCCAVSELFEWDKENVIITGSSDGIVRMWTLEYMQEGEEQEVIKPTKTTTEHPAFAESSLDRPHRKRASTIVKKLQETIKQEESDGRLVEQDSVHEEADTAGEERLLDEKSEERKVDSVEEGENKVDFEQTGEDTAVRQESSSSGSSEEYFDSSDQVSVGTSSLGRSPQLTGLVQQVSETRQTGKGTESEAAQRVSDLAQQDEATEYHDNTSKATMDDTPQATMDDTPQATVDDIPQATMDDTPQATMDDTPQATMDIIPQAAMDDTAKAVLVTTDNEACVLSEVTEEIAVDDTPKAMDDIPQATMDDTPKAMDDTPKATMDDTPKAPMLITTNTEAREVTEESGVEFLLSKLEKFQETLKLVQEHDQREEEAREWERERSSVYRTPEPESRDSVGSDSQTLRPQTPEVADTMSPEEPDINPTYAKMVADARKRTEELKRKAGNWTRKLTLIHSLTMHTSFSRKDNDLPAGITSICISKDHRRIFVGDTRGRIFSWSVSDNLGGVMEHWLKDEAVDNCMKCSVEFTFTERKHHCRDCGRIFCARCSAFDSEIERLRINKRVRVCVDCFEKIFSSNF